MLIVLQGKSVILSSLLLKRNSYLKNASIYRPKNVPGTNYIQILNLLVDGNTNLHNSWKAPEGSEMWDLIKDAALWYEKAWRRGRIRQWTYSPPKVSWQVGMFCLTPTLSTTHQAWLFIEYLQSFNKELKDQSLFYKNSFSNAIETLNFRKTLSSAMFLIHIHL